MENEDGINQDQPSCFVISPIGSKGSTVREDADTVLKHLIRKSLEPKFQVIRGDEDTNPGSITSRIVASILEADLIVADLSGHNANVFYEVAIAHGYRKAIVHIERDGEKPPFDLQDMRLVTYDTTKPDSLDEARATLAKYAEAAMSRPNDALTPLSHSQQFLAYSKSENPIENSMAVLLGEVRELRSEIRGPGTQFDRRETVEADRRQLATILSRIVDRGAIELSDLQGAIDLETSQKFDDWVKQLAQATSRGGNNEAVESVVYSSGILETTVGEAATWAKNR
ncbi:hypothetical protein [Brevibacterium sp. 'Marine']|uniref:hypothetical protein n=1 Tax=Brevibacterium sp. 'Marine' TaxID=2725563 RepID=UPI00145C705D|nr:hypothetical protein [Brevibacterium sp. 'Marine']